MRTVYKYQVPIQDDVYVLLLPDKAQILQAEFGEARSVLLWALVETTSPATPRAFVVRGTGMEVPARAVHIATVQSTPFVWHLFELDTTG